ncbi:MAG: hypothetical protein ACKVH8_18025 [Pirellulales bacterium]
MSALRYFRYLYQSYCSKPEHERDFYRQIRRAGCAKNPSPVTQIVEIGVGNAERAVRLIRFAQQYADQATIQYVGIDMFEGRPEQDGLKLKEAHKLLSSTGAKIKLVPGDAMMALPRVANGLADTDMIIIAEDQDRASVNAAWSWIPRMMNTTSQVFWESKQLGQKPEGTKWSFEKLDLQAVSESTAQQKRAA